MKNNIILRPFTTTTPSKQHPGRLYISHIIRFGIWVETVAMYHQQYFGSTARKKIITSIDYED